MTGADDPLDLRFLPSLKPMDAERLRRAGVFSVEDLRRADPRELAERCGIPEATVERLVADARARRPLTDFKGIGPATADELAAAGVVDVPGLLAADPEELAARTRIGVGRIRMFQEAARSLVEGEREPPREPVSGMRVLLGIGAVRARVFDGSRWREEIPLVTVKLAEDEDALMAEQRADVVLLKERSPVAYVRVDGAWHVGVPIFKERVGTDGSVSEVRVTVHEIRERRVEERGEEERGERGFLSRLLGD